MRDGAAQDLAHERPRQANVRRVFRAPIDLVRTVVSRDGVTNDGVVACLIALVVAVWRRIERCVLELRPMLDCADHSWIRGAAAQVAAQRVSDLVTRWVRRAIDQRLGRHQRARGAVAALQGTVLHECFLKRMQITVPRQPFDGGDFASLRLDREHETRGCGFAVDLHRARAAVAGGAAAFGACQFQILAKRGQQRRVGLEREDAGLPVDAQVDEELAAHVALLAAARAAARSNARTANTAMISRRNSTEPRMSLIGRAAATQTRAARAKSSREGRSPQSSDSTSRTSNGVGATAPSATRAPMMRSPSRSRRAATEATASDIPRRNPKRSKLVPLERGNAGSRTSTSNSPGARTVRRESTKNFAARTSRVPRG